MNNSASGGYLIPTNTSGFPRNLSLIQFIQTVLVGVSGLPPNLVRPKWQIAPPKQPDLNVDWLAYSLIEGTPNANAFVGLDNDGNNISQRHQDLKLQCALYGPNAMTYATVIQDGFQIQQNLEALTLSKMGYVSTGSILHIPDLVNERWMDRYEMELVLRREIQRTYAVLHFVSAAGTIHTVLQSGEYSFNFQAPEGS